MNIKQTTFNKKGPIQIQDHGEAYIVSYPSEQAGYQREKVFSKGIGFKAWQAARSFAKEMKEMTDG